LANRWDETYEVEFEVRVGRRRRIILDWLVTPLTIFIITRSAIFLAGYAGRIFFLDEIGAGPWHMHPGNPALDIWARWDSGFYLEIARAGYWYESSEAFSGVVFFPLYPLLMRLTAVLLGDLTLAGVVVSHLCLLGALIFLYRLALLECGDEPMARRAILYISIFPTAFFFGAVYSESAFLLFAAGCVYFARRRLWLPAALLGLAASATRVVGLALYVFLLIEWWQVYSSAFRRSTGDNAQPATPWRALAALLIIQLSAAGLLLYMAYLWRRFGDPLLFLNAQAAWSKEAGGSPAQLLRDLAAGFQALWSGNFSAYWMLPDALAGVAALAVTPLIWRRLGFNYAVLTALLLLVPILSGNSQSLMRYVLVAFPLFFLLAQWGKNDLIDKAIVVTSCVALGVLFTVFANWGWVA
jgi:hypothetical protein